VRQPGVRKLIRARSGQTSRVTGHKTGQQPRTVGLQMTCRREVSALPDTGGPADDERRTARDPHRTHGGKLDPCMEPAGVGVEPVTAERAGRGAERDWFPELGQRSSIVDAKQRTLPSPAPVYSPDAHHRPGAAGTVSRLRDDHPFERGHAATIRQHRQEPAAGERVLPTGKA
jgi:hypothetical protein